MWHFVGGYWFGLIMPMAKIVHSVVQDCCDIVQRSDNRNTCRKNDPIPLRLSQTPYEMSLYRLLATNVYNLKEPIKLRNKSSYGCNLSCRWLSLLCWPTRTDTPALCPASSSIIVTRARLKMTVRTFCLHLSTATGLVVMVGCVSIAGDRSSAWWSSGTLWQVFNIVAIYWHFINVGISRKILFVWTLLEAHLDYRELQEYGGNW
jgi:hypothetical protein